MHPILFKIPIPALFKDFHPGIEIPVFVAIIAVLFFLLRRSRFLVGQLAEVGFAASVAAFVVLRWALQKLVPDQLSEKGLDATLLLLGFAVAYYAYIEMRRLSRNSYILNDLIFWGFFILLGYGRSTIIGKTPDPLPLHTYGLLVALGFVVGIGLAARDAKRTGMNPEEVLDLCFWIIISALVGSRVLFIIVNIDDYIKNPLNVLRIWQGGLVFYGGFIGAVIASAFYIRKHKMNFFRTGDVMIPSLALGHVFGRLGCFAAGCCYGKVTDLPWAAHFREGSLAFSSLHERGLVKAGETAGLHPTQLYEASAELVVFLLLLLIRRNKSFNGQVFLSYLFLYPILRSVIEVFRGDAERGYVIEGFVSTSQFISLLVAACAIGLIYYLKRRKAYPQK